MYRITDEVAKLLLAHAKNLQLPELTSSEPLFVPKNSKTIGTIDPIMAIDSTAEYILETDYAFGETGNTYEPIVDGLWIYRNNKLKTVKEPVMILKALVDPNATDPEELLDVSDCCVEIPSAVEKLTCPKINSIKRLLELEPALKDCLTKIPEGGK